jgi:ABC-type amino acid transport substrate-binding protein
MTMSSSIQPDKFTVRHSLVPLFTIAVVVLLLASACGGSESTAAPEEIATEPEVATVAPVEPTAEPTVEPQQEPISEPAEETSVQEPSQTTGISVAVNANFKPFLYTDENGNLAGFDIDIMNALSAAGNFEVGYEDRAFDGMLEALAAGDYDAAMAAITINDKRKQIVDFTTPYFEPGQAPVSFFSAGQGIGVRSDNTDIMGTDDLSGGKIIGVKLGTTGDDFVSALDSVTVVRFDESKQTLDALVDGAVDAAVVDIAVITDYIKQSQGKVKLVGGPITEEEYGIAVNKDRRDVLEMLDAALAQIRSDGTYDQIFAKWFGTP